MLISEFTSGKKTKNLSTISAYRSHSWLLSFFLWNGRVGTWRFLVFSESPAMHSTVCLRQHIVGVQWESTSEYLITILSGAEVALSVLFQNWTG